MLYKKYHRNYISQFKVGTMIKVNFDHSCTTIRRGPYIEFSSQIRIIDSLMIRVLISHDGRLIRKNDIEIVG